MNVKKILASIISMAMLVPVATTIGDTYTNDDNVIVANAEASYSTWQEAYNTILQDEDFFKEVPYYTQVSDMYFDLAYIDGDDIPELVVYFNGSHYLGPSIVKYDEDTGTVGFILRSDMPTISSSEYGEFGYLFYVEKQGIILDNEAGMGFQSIDIFEVDGYTATLKESFVVEATQTSHPDDFYYYNTYDNGQIMSYDNKDSFIEISIDDIITAVESYGLTYTGGGVIDSDNEYLQFSGYETIDLQLSDENLNTSENRERIIGYDDTTTTTTTTNSEYSGSCGDNATWSFDETTGTLTISGTGATDDSYMSWREYSWFEIACEDFLTSDGEHIDSSLVKKLVVEEGITYVSDYMFNYFNNIESVELPSTLTSIGESAFFDCTSLKEVTIPNSVTSIGEYALGYYWITYNDEECTEDLLEDFTIKGYAGSAAETYATENGFTFVTLGDTTTTTNSEYSGSCGDNATWSLDTTTGTLTISGTGDMYDYDNIHFSTDELSSPWHKVIHDISDIKSIVIEEGITSIGKTAFLDLYYVESVQLPSTLKSIGEDAFRVFDCNGCENIFKTITIPESVTYIGDCALGYYDFSYSDENGDVQYDTDMYELTIKGYAGSAAETYATENGFTFVTLDNTDTTTSTSADTTTTNDDTTTTTTSNGDTDTTTTTASDGSAGTGDKGIIPILLIASLTGAVVITINKKNK